MLKKVYLLLVVFISLLPASVTGNTEYRAMWVTRFELTSPENISQIVQTAAANNFNALFVQVCGRGTAFYNSKILPRDDQAVSYDALEIFIKEAKKYDLEIHAWVNALYVWSDDKPPVSPKHVVNQHPEWLLTDKSSEVSPAQNKYLDPANPAVRDYVKSIYLEIINNYPVDGVHLDYIRYPGETYGYSPFARKDFEQKQGVDPLALVNNKSIAIKLYGPEDYSVYLDRWSQYRRDAISLIVRDLTQNILKNKPQVKLSAAVIANYDNAYANYFQDWPGWLESGYLDLAIPMVYDTDEQNIRKQIVFAAQAAEKYDRMVLIGLGAWRRKPQDVIDNIDYTRTIREKLGYKQLGGVVLFSYDSIATQNNYLETIRRRVFAEPVACPGLCYDRSNLVEKTLPAGPPEKEIDLTQHFNIIG